MSASQVCSTLRRRFPVFLVVLVIAGSAWAGSKYKVLHTFGGCGTQDGCFPSGKLTLDEKGNLYGATGGGGGTGCDGFGCGTVFALVRSAGGWQESIFYDFCQQSACTDGASPNGGLVFSPAGHIYGTTTGGGFRNNTGTTFALALGTGGWSESVLYDYGSYGGLVMDKSGDLYGTLWASAYSNGTVSELSREPANWVYTVLYGFGRKNGDGNLPRAGLTWDAAGNLYGTTELGGNAGCSAGCGTVFEVSPGSGGWTERVLYAFSNPLDGEYPYAGVVFDPSGNLYSATVQGGHSHGCDNNPCGTIFKLTPRQKGFWKKTVLYDFPNAMKDGSAPVSTPVFDSAGNLYGTAGGGIGPCNGGCGVVYRLSPGAEGKWNYTVLHKFKWSDGAYPDGGVIWDGKGHLYGTTIYGGANGGGVVFEITP